MRGYQKKVVYLKDTGSSLFEEAYFIIKEDGRIGDVVEADLVKEANRIVEEHSHKCLSKGFFERNKGKLIYALGFLSAVIVSATVYIINYF
ncbi:MAG: hypothetical protein IJY18_00165 [Clostridia bacterium]|nr:hypothetical protein [Clostridia bacterium]